MWRNRIRNHTARLTLASMLAALVLTPYPGGAGPVDAATCPSGWTAVTDASVPTVVQFCRKTIDPLFPPAYFIKVPAQHMVQFQVKKGATCTPAAGSTSDWHPLFFKQAVSTWLTNMRNSCGQNLGIVINGTFFRNTDVSLDTSDLSYPTLSSSPGMQTGYDINPQFNRVCYGFGGLNAQPKSIVWDINNTVWTDTQTEFNTAPPNGCGFPLYHKVVGISPTWVVGGDQPRTYLGTSNTSSFHSCIIVGGKFNPTSILAAFNAFGCTARVQLDGGNSTQMSYYRTNGTVFRAVWSYGLPFDRAVPHVIGVYR